MPKYLFIKKPADHVHEGPVLKRTLTTFDLTLLGIGAIVGAGVFVLTGIAAATQAGPAIILSFVLAGLAALFAALAYAELASSIGGAGSAYSYAYTGFGEIVAWLLGWDLLLEYMMSVATVSIGWSGYVHDLLNSLGLQMPLALSKSPAEGGVINLLAFLIIIALTGLLSLGAKHGARFNAAMVFVKLFTIILFLTVAVGNVHPSNWHPFMPFGFDGVINGAALVFFAYIGFDALSTTVEEAVEPQRTVPIGILLSLLICTLIYIAVASCLTGIVPYTTLNVKSPVSNALLHIGYPTAAGFIAAGAIAGLTTVMLVMFYGSSRIILAVARDGLFPSRIATIHPQTHTPVKIIVITGLFIALVAGFAPINRAAELVNIGTLAAFTLVSLGTIVLRSTHPDLPRPFKLPFSPFIPLLGAAFCIYLMTQLPLITWASFGIWSTLGVIIYFCYGYHHSVLRKKALAQSEDR